MESPLVSDVLVDVSNQQLHQTVRGSREEDHDGGDPRRLSSEDLHQQTHVGGEHDSDEPAREGNDPASMRTAEEANDVDDDHDHQRREERDKATDLLDQEATEQSRGGEENVEHRYEQRTFLRHIEAVHISVIQGSPV